MSTQQKESTPRQYIRSEQTRQRMRRAHLGRKLSGQHRAAISAGMKKAVRHG
jgi:hypothetical protein